jgi:DNA-binding transcriptional ArsR family regulator
MENIVKNEGPNEAQLKALFDPVRIRIASCLKVPRTPKQVADIINIRPNNLYHHFRVLEKAGIIEHIETKPGKGFIKEDFFRLKEPEYLAGLTDVPSKHRKQFLFGLFQALIDDFKTTVARYEQTVALGSRNDFRFREEDLENVSKTVMKHRDELRKELSELAQDDTPPTYQVSVFGFRV